VLRRVLVHHTPKRTPKLHSAQMKVIKIHSQVFHKSGEEVPNFRHRLNTDEHG
jgi:hypothetical protein